MAEAPRTKKRLRSNSISEETAGQPNIQLIGAIHVSPLPIDVKFGQLLDHFAEFGDVKELVVRHQLKNDFAVGIVTFEQAEDAKKALAGNHRVLGEVRNVSTAIANPILTCIAEYERPFKSTMALTDLPNDCLRLIFQMLDITDLCSIADTCSRFRAIRVTTLSTVHKTMYANGSHITEFQKIVAKFGSGINDLYLSVNERQPEKSLQILQLSMDYCSFTLKSLTLLNYRIDESMIPKLRGLFVNLESLTLYLCEFDELISTSLLSECRKLIKLELYLRSDNFPSKAFINCPPVECLELILDEELLNNENEISKVVKFLKSQRSLQKLTLSIPRLDQRILNVITDYCWKHLTSLHFSEFRIDMLMVPKLRILFSKLEELKIDFCSLDVNITELFSECKHLTKLSCIYANFYNTIFNESDLPELEYLKFELLEEPSAIDIVRFEAFLKSKEKLRTLSLDTSVYTNKSIFEIIAGKNMQVIELNHLRMDKFHLCSPLSKLDGMTTLKIVSNEEPDEPDVVIAIVLRFIKNISCVEHLHYLKLSGMFVDRDVLVEISKFKNLRNLHLGPNSAIDLEPLNLFEHLSVVKLEGKWSISDTALINLVTNMKNLTKLTLALDKFTLGYKIYNEMIKIVHGREKTITILTDVYRRYYDASLLIERDVNPFNNT